MRSLFLFLLAACLAVFAWQQGYFGELPAPGREPERLARQIAPDSLRLLDAAQVAQIKHEPPPAPVDSAAPPPACLVFGDFEGGDLNRVRDALAALTLGDKLSTTTVDGAGWYMVYLPPAKNRAEAERRAEELRAQGVRDVAVIGDGSPYRNGLVLGSFRDPNAAKEHAAALEKRGIKGARAPDRPSSRSTATRFTLHDLDADSVARIKALAPDFPQQKITACPTQTAAR
ncbi:MAG: SPOR domain-containing protein [Burkholderiaceae bacterium]